MHLFIRTGGALVLSMAAWGGDAKYWEHSSRADFEKGTIKKLSLRSDGRLTLAPVFRELYDPSSNYLWSVARDSKGVLYTGGSGQDGKARVFAVDAAGKGSVVAELPGLAVYAIAIDKQDRVYAATSPDGKIHRVRAGAAAEVFYDPKAKYIWALAFDAAGNLYAATGDKGEIHRVTPAGQGSVFFKADEAHIRSMTLAPSGDVYAGTEPSGLVIRVSAAGQGFVVYQAAKREITALAIAPNGDVYAAAAGAKTAATAPAAPVAAPPPAPAAGPAAPARPPAPPPPPTVGSAVTGGSEVLRIEADGYPRPLWSHANDIAYALAFDASGKLLIGTGNGGALHRLENDLLSTLVLTASPTQVTGLLNAGGAVYAVTGNIGKVYKLGPELEKEGTYESNALDAGFFARWGRANYGGTLAGGGIKLETRSGNLDSPGRNWSPWALVPLQSDSGRIASPAARFLQYRVTLSAPSATAAPGAGSVGVAYQPKNVAPVIERVDMTPANYRFPVSSLTLSSAGTMTLPALTRTSAGRPSANVIGPNETPATSMNPARGWMGARWLARDDNGDALSTTLEIRGARESAWRPLKTEVRDRHYSWDASGFPDGEYVLRVTVSDAPSNPPGEELTSRLEGDVFVVDQTPPRITGLAATRQGSRLEVRWRAADALNTITKAEYSVDGGEWRIAPPTTGLSDSREHEYVARIENAAAGDRLIAVRVIDEYDNTAVEKVVAQ